MPNMGKDSVSKKKQYDTSLPPELRDGSPGQNNSSGTAAKKDATDAEPKEEKKEEKKK